MITSLFKTRQPGFYTILVMIALGLFSLGLRNNVLVIRDYSMPLYSIILSIPLNDQTFFFSAMLLFVLQVIHLNSLVNRFDILYQHSYLPGLMYALLTGCIPEFLVFSPTLLVNSLLLLILDRLFRIFKTEEASRYLFEAACLLSVAALIYLPAAGFLVALLAALLILRPFVIREWLATILGLVTPVYILAFSLFFDNNIRMIIPDWKNTGISLSFDWKNVIPASYKLSVVFISLLMFLSLIKLREHFYKNVARTRSFQQVIFILGGVTLLILLLTSRMQLYRYVILALPCSVMTGYFFIESKKKWIADSLFLLFLVIILINHFTGTFHL
ncbi:MAG: hypothetical protein LC117_05810 [Bacteroidia bacterium]|nr:hypothetical protein [Bacteroidia bacterium]MCZ2277426.1 hypothetical protein [Bacteroidia bacterium]